MNRKYILLAGLFFSLSLTVLLSSCKTIPKGVTAVKPFDKSKYLGKWYEIARFDFRFERGLNNVTATYTLREDDAIKVVNRGYDYKNDKWKEAIGKAKFVKDENEARLKVSFFGPFYAGYNVIALDKDYKYALVAGQNFNYLWILSRETSVPPKILQNYLDIAQKAGFETNNLIWVEHTKK